MQTQYENQGGLLVVPGTNQCAGYIFNLAKAELDHASEVGKATFYLTYDRTICTPDNPRWRQENAGTWHYSNYRVSNWVGSWKSPHCFVRRGYSYGFGRFETFWIWFTGPDGKQWYGVLKGDMSCFNARRLKKQGK